MTENERLTIDEIIQHCNRTCENTEMLAIARGQNQEDITSKGYWEHYQVANYLEELKQYRAIGTVEEFKALKEKNTPMELDEHNFQDEPHHYLCPSCRCIVSYTQNYCEWCGQALET